MTTDGAVPPVPRGEGRTFARSAATSYAERGLLVLSTLALTPYLFRTLGVGGFGTWSVIFTVTTIFSVLEMGVGAGITKFTADALAAGRRADAARITSVGAFLLGCAGVLALGVCLLLGMAGDGLAAAGERDDFRTGMLLVGIGMLLRFPLVAYGAGLAGHQRYDLFNAARMAVTAGLVVGSVVAVEAGSGVAGVAGAHAGALVLGGLGYVVFLRRLLPGLPLSPRTGSAAERRRLLGFGGFALLAESMVFVGQRMDTMVVATIRGAAAAGPLAAATKFQSGLTALSLPVINLLMPMAADLHSRDRSPEVARRHRLATRFTLQLTLPFALACVLFAHDITELWLGAEAPRVTGDILAVLAAQTLFLAAAPADRVLVGVGRVRVIGLLNTAEGLLNLTISIFLVSRFGAIGAAIGSLVASTLLGPVKWPVACRALGDPLWPFLRNAVGRALVGAALGIAAMVTVRLTLDEGAGRLLIGSGLGLSLAGAVAVAQLGPAGRSQLAVRLRALRGA